MAPAAQSVSSSPALIATQEATFGRPCVEEANCYAQIHAATRPVGLSHVGTARYIGVGATKFDQLVADGRMRKPKRIDGCVVWDQLVLDMAFADLPGDADVNIIDFLLEGRHWKGS